MSVLNAPVLVSVLLSVRSEPRISLNSSNELLSTCPEKLIPSLPRNASLLYRCFRFCYLHLFSFSFSFIISTFFSPSSSTRCES
jgi:hypothetical protein